MVKALQANKIVIAGGGTGGHFFCGLAVAEHFLEAYPDAQVVLVGVQRGIEGRYRLQDRRMRLVFIPAKGFMNQSFFQKIEAIVLLLRGCLSSLRILIRERPRAVIGVGGYASAPCILAAYFLKLFLGFKLSVVDQNSVPGLVNRFFSKLGVRAFCPFPFRGFQLIKMPIRKNIEEHAKQAAKFSWPPKCIFVQGGSQGAAGLNKAWIRILPQLKAALPEARYIHQTGASSLDNVQTAYQELGMDAECFGFTDEIARYLSQADLVVSRSGALSSFELIEFQRPTVFVPFPRASEDHQFKNAIALQESSWVVAEAEFCWERMRGILSQSVPSLPRPRNPAQLTWRALLS
ncbi:MAG: hypothetical protein COV44_06370 [Deltaproteobacteria bacterium CG11_big_fil_rev_8_21_14_0_20_45_16]|nr:MAG: hypothetical protein COV44_06370 [Deltaproteobacteria bacterium CG11_big_fil_rev_8_21_14_0_20_45_16]